MLMTSSMLVHETVATNVANRYTSTTSGVMNTPYVLRLFSGQPPTKSQIRDLVAATTSEARYAMSRVPALLTKLGGKVVASMGNTANGLLVHWGPAQIKLALSALAEQATSLQDDPPTWGLVYMFPYTVNANPDSWEATMLAYFTVGPDLNSDLVIPGGVIPAGSVWKPADDLILDVTGGIS